MLKRKAAGSGGVSKPSSSSTGKSGGFGKSGLTSSGGKSGITASSGGKSGLTSSGGKAGLTASGGKSALIPSSGKSALIPSSGNSGLTSFGGKSGFPLSDASSGKHKSSTGFGVIWIPGRRHNRQKKDKFYNSLKEDYSKPKDQKHNYFMSGDSTDNQLYNKPDVCSDKSGAAASPPPLVAGAVAGSAASAAAAAAAADPTTTDDSSTILLPPNENHATDKNEADSDTEDEKIEFLENEKLSPSSGAAVEGAERSGGDTMDHVRVQPPVEKAREAAEGAQGEDDRCVTCLYYAIECCDCTIM